MKKGLLLLCLWTIVFRITAASQTVTPLAPAADAFVRSDQYATVNYGTDPSLIVKGATSSGYTRNSYIKFSLSSLTGNITSAKLRLYGRNTESTTAIATSAYSANTDAWTEAGINYNNRPSHPTTALSVVNVNNVAKYYEWDVTAFVKAQFTGDKIVSLVLKNASKQNRSLSFSSRENSLNPPQLLVTTDAPPANQAPLLSAIGNKNAIVGQPLNFTATATDANAGQTLTFSLSGAPGGAVIDAVSGAFNWTPAATGSATFTVHVEDNGTPVKSDDEEITVIVNDPPPNQPPVLDAIGNRNVIVGQAMTFTANATDPDAGQTKTYSLGADAPSGATIDGTTGVFTWTPAATGDYTFTVSVSDNGSPVLTDDEQITVTVTEPPPNQEPVLAAIGSRPATIGQPLTFTASATDADAGQVITYSLGEDAPSGAAINATTGAFSWTPSALGSFQFTVRVSDNGSPVLTDAEQIVVTVGQPNQKPVLSDIGHKSLIIGQTLTFTATVTDPDAGQTENFYLIDAPEDATIDATTGEFSWTPATTGSFTFTVHVSDDGEPALSDEKQITVTVNAVNQEPVLGAIGDKTTSVGQTLTFTAKATDPDAGQTKNFSLIGAPNGAAINATSGVFSWKPTAGGNFTFTVRVTDNGSPTLRDEEQITVTVSSATVTLAPVADAFVRNGQYATINYGNKDSLVVKGSTTSGYARSPYLKFSLSGLTGSVTSAKLRVYGNNTENTTTIATSVYRVTTDTWTESGITWNNAPAAASSTALSTVGVNNVAAYYELDVTAFVQGELAGDKVVSLLLKNASNQGNYVWFNSRENPLHPPQLLVSTTSPPTNQAPVLGAIGDKTTTIGQALTFTVTATDPDAGQTKNFSLIGAPGGAVINSSGNFSWTPAASGNFTFKVRVTDNGSPVLYDEELISVTVTGAVTTATFSNSQTNAIPNPGTALIPITVSGLPNQIDTTAYGLQSLSVQLTHPADKELTLQLKSPDGKVIYLFRKSPGVNINTTFDAVSTRFIDNNEIAAYSGSFTSGYRPRQDLALLNNGQNPNGTWNLVVNDDNAASATGEVTRVSLVFGAKPAKPLLSASNLPIIKIYTDRGVDIPDDPKVLADMYIINNSGGATNYANQTTYEYQGKIGIEIRGNSSASLSTLPKRQYGFETRTADGVSSVNVSLFGMPSQSDWILSAVMSDKSLMRNMLTYQLARDMGYWASRTKFVEVMINDEYRGVFIFQEKIKRDKNRVNIEKLATTDVTEPNVTGGYIFAVDDLDPGDKTWVTRYDPKPGNPYKFVTPKPEDLQTAQRTYLQNYVGDFEDALHGSNFQDPTNGFRKYIDEKSFMDFFIVNEFAKNNDAYRFSTYFNKKRGGKIVAGPVWDFDRAYRNEATCDSKLPSGYIYSGTNNCGSRIVPWWWARLLEDSKYKADLVCRYNMWRQNVLSLQRVKYIIDSAANVLNAGGAQQRNFIRWNVWGKYVERIPAPYTTNYAMEIDTIKNWITKRLAWLDNDLGPCTPATQLVTRSVAAGDADFENDGKVISNIYPSPFKDQLSIAITVRKEQPVTVQLLDINGKSFYQKVFFLRKGTQLLQLNVKEKQLATGLYLLQVTGRNVNVVKKVLKE